MLCEVKPGGTVKGALRELFNIGGLFLLLEEVFQVNVGIKVDSQVRQTHRCHQWCIAECTACNYDRRVCTFKRIFSRNIFRIFELKNELF